MRTTMVYFLKTLKKMLMIEYSIFLGNNFEQNNFPYFFIYLKINITVTLYFRI